MKNLKIERLSDRVVEKFISMIEQNEFKAGEKLLGEITLSREFGVSRGILREAFNTLESKGYIIRKNGIGSYVREEVKKDEQFFRSLRTAEYIELLEAREAIEQKVVELVIERSSNLELDELAKEVENEIHHQSKNTNFHLKLAELSKNKIFFNFILMYYDLIAELGEVTYKQDGRYQTVLNEHSDILKAIQERNIIKAKKLIYHHFELAKSIVSTETTK